MLKSTINFFTIAFFALLLVGCSKDDTNSDGPQFVAAFENQSISFSSKDTQKDIQIVFSNPAPQNGVIHVALQLTNTVYGEDFKTIPAASQGIIEIPVKAGAKKVSFQFNKLTPNPEIDDPEKSVEFSIVTVDLPNGITQGNTKLSVTYAEKASLGSSIAPNVGGPNEPNQVYIDLSSEIETVVRRDAWDLGFYSGDQFRVKLNSSLFMLAAPLSTTDIDAVNAQTVAELQPKMTFTTPGSNIYVDQPNGDITQTAIAEISSTPEENKVYLVKMGDEVGTDPAATGSVALSGAKRGWKKIRITQKDGGYLLQYADLDATTHEEVFIPKNTGYNFNFFSFASKSTVKVEPAKTQWDLAFTTFTEVFSFGENKTAYGYSDYVRTNRLGNTEVYAVSTADISYDKFTKAAIVSANFSVDQNVIGGSWRDVMSSEKTLKDDIFYVIKDADGNFYKLKFTALLNTDGERGYPEFQYDLLK